MLYRVCIYSTGTYLCINPNDLPTSIKKVVDKKLKLNVEQQYISPEYTRFNMRQGYLDKWDYTCGNDQIAIHFLL